MACDAQPPSPIHDFSTDALVARRREQRLLRLEHTVARCLADTDDAGDALRSVIEALCETEGWEYGRYWQADERAGVLRFAAAWHVPGSAVAPHLASSESTEFAPGAGMVGRVWQSGKPLWISDLTQRQHVLKATLAPGLALHGACMFPVASQGRTIGVMSFVSREVREPDERLLMAFRVIGSQVGQFLTRKQREEALRESEARFRSLAELQGAIAAFGRKALANVDLAELLREARKVVTKGLAVDFCHALVLDPEGRARLPENTQSAQVMATGRPVVVDDFDCETRFAAAPALQAQAICSGIEVAITGGTSCHGALGAYCRQRRRFTQDNVDFLQSLANTLATAIDRKSAEQRLAYMAQFDPLTGLANRSLLSDRIVHTLAQARRNGWQVGVLFIDLDRFKLVNDTLGHDAGDRLLVEVAQRLVDCVRASDTVSRLGGDEFACVLSQLAKVDDAALVAQKIVTDMARPFTLAGQQVYVSASVGIGIFPNDGADADTLLRNADTAMYRAKEQGRNAYQFYLPQMNEQLLERMQLQTQLRGALERREFVLHYQPKADLASGEVSGFEALLRWQHPVRGLVPPLQFISILEETGLIVQVGEWVVRSVCEQLMQWRAQGLTPRPVAINLSARQFQQRNLDASIAAIIEQTGVDAGLLEFELTESLLMRDPEEATRVLNNMRSFGVRLSVDDFGTGYSSLSYLKRFPLDALKIDRAFVREVTSDADDASITVAIIGLAHTLKLKVVAEGVETEAQLAFLRANQCDEMQGFYFAKPLAVADCTQFLAQGRRLALPAQAAA